MSNKKDFTYYISVNSKGNNNINIIETLFFLTNTIRINPSHSLKLIGGGGLYGSIRTTDESTCGEGLKLFFPTYCKQNQH